MRSLPTPTILGFHGKRKEPSLECAEKETLGNGWVVLDTKLALLHDLVYIYYSLYTGKWVRKAAKDNVGGY